MFVFDSKREAQVQYQPVQGSQWEIKDKGAKIKRAREGERRVLPPQFPRVSA